ncbi:MAG TPA: protein phosphatase CheZ [Bacteroidota bacterium]|nr:protein phosphatase CheZ [Bacteroidota bacterium]
MNEAEKPGRSKTLHAVRLRKSQPARATLDNFIRVVAGVIPLLDSVKESLEESTGSIPKASRQLDNVTKATETATVEILDLLERMSARVDSLGATIAGVREAVERGESRLGAIDGLVASLRVSHPLLHERWSEFRAAGGTATLPAGLDAEFGALRSDVMNIGMALQVQDITTQQIAGVSHTIESIRMHLSKVLENFNQGEKKALSGLGKDDPAAEHFNGDAEFSRSPDRQEDADEIVKRWNRGNHA